MPANLKELSQPYWMFGISLASLWNAGPESLGTNDIRDISVELFRSREVKIKRKQLREILLEK